VPFCAKVIFSNKWHHFRFTFFFAHALLQVLKMEFRICLELIFGRTHKTYLCHLWNSLWYQVSWDLPKSLHGLYLQESGSKPFDHFFLLQIFTTVTSTSISCGKNSHNLEEIGVFRFPYLKIITEFRGIFIILKIYRFAQVYHDLLTKF
jgi:hypothetical protein